MDMISWGPLQPNKNGDYFVLRINQHLLLSGSTSVPVSL
jgi:hypothetical protein